MTHQPLSAIPNLSRVALTRLALKRLAGLLFAGLLLGLLALPPSAAAMPAPTPSSPVVVEYLHLKVPAAERQAWLLAEQQSWGPWLAEQDGFLGRDLYWDPSREEGVLLIRWRDQEAWFGIPTQELDAVQERFEAAARRATGSDTGNPFPLVAEGKLLPQAVAG
jgi:uncharacterized protein (TIGR03792 family)